ncbi:MFS transporter [Thalassobacillus hwangdonensis]|uniref:MFS transporter n=1 Tax=Thalassobacillus hwangdonensis TaxID=546108 RepID=A0ABW3L0I9_9BACI
MNKQLFLLLIGRIMTNLADSLYMIATIWYVKEVTASPFLIGLTSAIAMLPVTIQFLYGPIIDRFPKRKILFIAEAGQGVLLAIISILYFAETLWLPLLFVFMFMALSLAEATYPTENALIQRLAGKESLTKVNSIFAFSYQTLDIILDAISGILILFLGIGIIYASNSLLLLAIGFMFLLFLKVPSTNKERSSLTEKFFVQYKEDFVEGYQVVRKQTTLLAVLFGIIVINVMATMGLAMLPVISDNPAEYGFWLTAMSIGTLCGTVISSRLDRFLLRGIFPIASALAGLAWIGAFLFYGKAPLIICMVLFGVSWVAVGILSIYVQTIIQVNLPEDHVGSGFAFLSSLLGSLSPLGYMIGGLLGEWSGAEIVLMIAGSGYLVFTIYFLIHPTLKNLNNRINEPFQLHN